MVEPTFLAVGAVIFFIILVLILRNGASVEQKSLKKEKGVKPTPQKQKPKRGRTALRKNERVVEQSEWVGVDTSAKDAQDMLEFLKGKDPQEIAKQRNASNKKKKVVKKQEVEESEDSVSESEVSNEGFEEVKKKVVDDKKKKKKKEKKPAEDGGEKKKKEKPKKPYFKPLEGETPAEDSKGEKRERRPRRDGEEGARPPREEGARPPREEGERRERKPRSDGETTQDGAEKRERKPRPEGEKRERKPRAEGDPERPVRRPITSPPNVKYEQADLNDILNSITQDFHKPKVPRIDTAFSKLPRHTVLRILSKLEARDLVHLSGVNHSFNAVAHKDSLWRDLLLKDFGLRETGPKKKNFRATYIAEFSKRRKGRKQREESAPTGEEKDAKAEAAKGGKKDKKPKKEESTAQADE